MAVSFRCENCGKLLNVDAQAGSAVTCPHCQAQLSVPEGLAGLPTPQVPGQQTAQGQPAQPGQPGQPPQPGEEEYVEEESEAMTILAAALPWVISVFLHAGLLLIMAFFVLFVKAKYEKPAQVVVPDAFLSEDPGGVISPGDTDPNLQARQPKPTDQKQYTDRESSIPTDAGETDNKLENLFGRTGGGSAGGGLAEMGLSKGGSGRGPKSSMYGSGGNAYHICYVIDRSGSMVVTFDYVRRAMIKSIRALKETQDFHIILFAKGDPLEMSEKRLVPATRAGKMKALNFLEPVRAEKQTDPIPALERAFAVLANADTSNGRIGKLVYLLTDGVFPDNEKVIDYIKAKNPTDTKNHIYINTFMYGNRPPEAVRVLKQIAEMTGGKYKFVSEGE